MSTESSGDHTRTAHAASETYVASGDPDGAGLYVTNEVFLYRVVGIDASGMGEMVELEDCYSLHVGVWSRFANLDVQMLRVVTATPVQA